MTRAEKRRDEMVALGQEMCRTTPFMPMICCLDVKVGMTMSVRLYIVANLRDDGNTASNAE